MRKKSPRPERERLLGSGWTLESDAPDQDAAVSPTGASVSSNSAGASETHLAVDEADTADAPPADDVDQVSSGALLLYGIFGGVYGIYTWVWITWAQYYAGLNALSAAGSGSVGGVLQQIVYWAAPVAPGLWFLCVVLAVRTDLRRMTVLLILGAIVLLPLPMFLQGAGL